MKNRIFTLLLAACTFIAWQSQAGVAFPDPPGGWTYIYDGSQLIVGGPTGFSSLDGTWSHDNGSDQWDGSTIGGTFTTGGFGVGNAPGGVNVFTEGGATYLRIQDTGDPTDYGFPDPSNRKIYFGHDMEAQGATATVLNDGVTLTFRARLPTPSNTTNVLDPWHRDGQQAGGVRPFPPGGDGYVTSDGGKGNFVIKQGNGAAGAIAFSFTQTNDTTGGGLTPTANFAGLTMNEFNGNQISGTVNFGQGSGTNVVAFDPTQWHEFWIVIRADPAGVGTHQAFIYLDGSLTPFIFKITAGNGSDYNVSYLAIGMTATGQNCALDVDFVGYKLGVEFPPGAFDNLPPEITSMTPARNTVFHPSASGITLTATTQGTNSIPTNGVQLTLNGANLSSNAVVSGTVQNRTISIGGLLSNVSYNGEVIVSDQAGRSTTNQVSFDTFVESGVRMIEAEDFNFGDATCNSGGLIPGTGVGGQYFDNPTPSFFDNVNYHNQTNGYVDRVGEPGIDFFDISPAGGTANNAYRFCDPVGTQTSSDAVRAKYTNASSQAGVTIPDYDVSLLQPGEWLNYTRQYTNQTFLPYLRIGSAAAQTVRLDLVGGDRSNINQTVSLLGVFNVPNTGGQTSYRYVPLTDAFGNPLVITLNGEQTLRLTAQNAADNMRLNYLLLVPSSGGVVFIPTVTITSPAADTAYSSGPTNITVTADASVTNGRIARVEFFSGSFRSSYATNKIGEATNSPFSITWTNVEPGTYFLAARATDTNGFAVASSPIKISVAKLLSINFQDAATPATPAGYLPDIGDVYGDRANGFFYGWDATNTAHARNRNSLNSPDERYDTFTHLQKTDPLPAGSFWEIQVPNGQYKIEAVSGDPDNFDGVFDLQAEGITIVSYTPIAASRFGEGSGIATVTDGRLTIGNGPLAVNNKVNFLDIYQLSAGGGQAQPVTIISPTYNGNNVSFSFGSTAARSYRVEYRTNLVTGSWQTLTNVAAAGSTAQISDSTTSSPQRFYRVISE